MTATLELPNDLHLSQGERISLLVEAEALDGKIVVRQVRMSTPPVPEPSEEERVAAVERFLENRSARLGGYSDEVVDAIRWEALKG
jgi:hypothetical protein